jgi:hypothetical protein
MRPFAKVVRQTTTPRIAMVVRPTAFHHGSVAKVNTTYCHGGMADNDAG